MAPTKPSGITQMVTRMRAAANPKATVNPSKAVVENNSLLNKKRKAETVLTSENKKRSALGDLTNVSLLLFTHLASMSFVVTVNRPIANSRMPRKPPRQQSLHPLLVALILLGHIWLAPPLKHLP